VVPWGDPARAAPVVALDRPNLLRPTADLALVVAAAAAAERHLRRPCALETSFRSGMDGHQSATVKETREHERERQRGLWIGSISATATHMDGTERHITRCDGSSDARMDVSSDVL
jgi:Mg2+/citrate symporter